MKRQDGKLRIYGVGPDGRDDGGQGPDWQSLNLPWIDSMLPTADDYTEFTVNDIPAIQDIQDAEAHDWVLAPRPAIPDLMPPSSPETR